MKSAKRSRADVEQPHIVPVTVFPDRYAKRIIICRLTLTAIANLVRRQTAPSKAELPLLKFATFGDKRSAKGCLRIDGNVTEVFGIEGDYDTGTLPITTAASRLKRAGVSALFYSSPSSTDKVHKWRVLCLLAKPIKGNEDELRNRRQHWVGVLNALLGNVLAPESFNLSLTYYFGAVAGRPESTAIQTSGIYIDELPHPPLPVMPAACRKAKKPVKAARKLTRAEAAKMDERFARLIQELQRLGLYRGRDGSGTKHTIQCPWAFRHTDKSDDSAAIWEPSDDNNSQGGFKCFHTHCMGLNMQHLRNFLTRALTKYYERRAS